MKLTTIKSIVAAALCAVGLSALATPQKIVTASDGGCDVTWELTSNNTVLTLGGTGPMINIRFLNEIPWYSFRTAITTAKIESGVTSIANAFYGCSALTSVTIASSVTSIGEAAFYGCSSLKSVTIPSGVKSIGMNAFSGCSELTSVTMPGVTSIGGRAFYDCSALKSVTIPSSVTSIGDNAIAPSTSSKQVTVLATTPPTAGNRIFGSATAVKTLYVPGMSVEAYKAANNWSTYEAKIVGMTANVTLPTTMGYGFVVSNLTAGATAAIQPTETGGLTYALPTVAKVGIYAVPEKGYVVTGTPYIINEVKSDTTIVTSNLPKAEKKTYAITYVMDGGVVPGGSPTSYTVVDSITVGEATKQGHTFDGWTWAEQLTPVKTVSIPAGHIGDIEFTAHWTKIYTLTLPATTGYAFAVSNLTAVAEEIQPTEAGGLTYLLPIGKKVGIYAVPEEGYVVTGEPLIIDEVKEDTTIDTSKLPKGEKGSPAGEGTYVFAKDGSCTIFGTGSVTNFPAGFDRESITSAEVKDGITVIGARFFKNCTNMKAVTFGKDVVAFGEKAFYKCFSLETINVANADSLESLTGVVNYHMMWDANGKFVVAPKINIPGYVEMLYGKVNLSDAEWMPIGELSKQNLEELKDENLYHFFQTRLVKEQ